MSNVKAQMSKMFWILISDIDLTFGYRIYVCNLIRETQ
jgi:hypothetical protein